MDGLRCAALSYMRSLSPRRWPELIAASIVVLNLLDAMFTLAYTQVGLAREANPLLEPVLADSPVGFVLVKLGLVSLGVALLWRLRHRATACVGLIAGGVAYSSLLLLHLSAVPALVALAP